MKSQTAVAASLDGPGQAALFWGLTPQQAAILAGIVLVTIAIYLPSLRNGWVLDDHGELVKNKLIHNWSFLWDSFSHDNWWFNGPSPGPHSSYYRPLENVWFWINDAIFGLRPALWHLEKIALHVVVVVLSFRAAQLLAGDVTVGLLTAAIFAVLPAHTGAVVFASAIPEPLSLAFELGSLILLIGRRPGLSQGLIGASILYVCAALTHESAVLFPFVVAAYLLVLERRDIGSTVRVCAPFFVVAAAYLCARYIVLGPGSMFVVHFEDTGTAYVRAVRILRPDYTLVQFLMTLPKALMIYLGALIVPMVAEPVHGLEWVTHPQPMVFVETAALIVVAAIAVALAWRSANRRLYLFCSIWSALTMAPALNLNSLWWLVDERYLYAPSFGWSLAFAIAAIEMAARSSRVRRVVGVALAALLTLYVVATMRLEHYWNDDITFYSQAVQVAPRFADFRYDLANALNDAGEREQALRVLEEGAALAPDDAHMHLRLAQQYQMMNRQIEFFREFQKFNELSAARVEQRDVSPAETPAP